jgi:hypothetical protein
MSAKTDLLQRWSSFNLALIDPLLIDLTPSDVDHNARARILRNGLAVVGFAMLEDFIRSRLTEVLAEFHNAAYTFVELPDQLRAAVTVDAVHGLSSKLRIQQMEAPEAEALVVSVSRDIASSDGVPFRLTSVGFASTGSNVKDKDITTTLKALSIEGGWNAIDSTALRTGMGGLALCEAFRSMASMRHKAAHVATTNVPTGDLESMSKTIVAIAVGFDSLISTACMRLISHDRELFRGRSLTSSDVSFRFIQLVNGKWKESKEGSTRASGQHSTKERAIASALARSTRHHEVVVVLTAAGIVEDWFS